MAHATHANAALTPRARLRLGRLVVDHGWSPARAAERYDVSWRTAQKWAGRYRDEGPAGMLDRSSAPHHQPNRTPTPVVRKIVHLRWKQRLGPASAATWLIGRPLATRRHSRFRPSGLSGAFGCWPRIRPLSVLPLLAATR